MAALEEELLRRIRRVHFAARGRVDDWTAGRYRSAFRGRGMEFEELREYVPGDEVRSIDWNTTARMNRPHVKIHRDERQATVYFLLDVSGSSRFGTRARFRSEVAAEAAALLAYAALRNQDRVGFLAFSDRVEKFVAPRKGRGAVWSLIREILSFEAAFSGTDLAAPFQYLNRVHKRRAVVFLLSDFLGAPLPPELAVAARRHDLVAVTLTDPREREIPDVGYLTLEDAETGERVVLDTASRRVRGELERRARERREERSRYFRAHGIDEITVEGDPVEPLVAFLRRRRP